MAEIRLGEIAHARSGDKGASANVGVIARNSAAFDFLRQSLSAERVEKFFKPMGVGRVIRYEAPNLQALNFLLPGVLQSGGSTSLRIDAQGKALGQVLLEMEIDVPDNVLSAIRDSSARVDVKRSRTIYGDVLSVKSGAPDDQRITVLTLKRPEKRNALNIELIEALHKAIGDACASADVRAIIIRGEGPVFCAGLDMQEAADPAASHRSAQALAQLYTTLYNAPVVTIAAAHGSAFGGGAGLMAACDLAVISDDMRIGYPEVHRGLVAALVICLLRRQISARNLRELLLLGQPIDAARAVQMGLANRAVPGDAVLDTALELARQSCAGARGAIARTKSLMAQLDPIEPDIELALKCHLEARDSDEASEGFAAFLEKRPPNWPPPARIYHA